MKIKFGELLPMLDEDTGLEVSGAEEQEPADPVETEAGAEEQELADPVEEKSGKSDADSAFAELRRQNEDLQKRNEEYEEALGLFFDGDDKDVQAHAYYEDRPIEEVVAEREAKEELEALQNENAALKENLETKEVERLMERDLAAIQEIDPNIKTLDDLGEDFLSLIATGKLTGTQAYYAAKSMQDAKAIKKPDLPGAANQSPEEKEYFTRDEVDNMSASEVHKNYDNIRKSMSKW
jgi:hypothetical protein